MNHTDKTQDNPSAAEEDVGSLQGWNSGFQWRGQRTLLGKETAGVSAGVRSWSLQLYVRTSFETQDIGKAEI